MLIVYSYEIRRIRVSRVFIAFVQLIISRRSEMWNGWKYCHQNYSPTYFVAHVKTTYDKIEILGKLRIKFVENSDLTRFSIRLWSEFQDHLNRVTTKIIFLIDHQSIAVSILSMMTVKIILKQPKYFLTIISDSIDLSNFRINCRS